MDRWGEGEWIEGLREYGLLGRGSMDWWAEGAGIFGLSEHGLIA